MKRKYLGHTVNETYFYKAMDFYRDSIGSSDRNIVIFVVGSDDIKWCKEVFKSRSDVYYLTDKKNQPYQDMSTLSHCNHTIVDYGTFGTWVAMLAGGRSVWPSDYSKIPRYQPAVMVNQFPKWIFLSEKDIQW